MDLVDRSKNKTLSQHHKTVVSEQQYHVSEVVHLQCSAERVSNHGGILPSLETDVGLERGRELGVENLLQQILHDQHKHETNERDSRIRNFSKKIPKQTLYVSGS